MTCPDPKPEGFDLLQALAAAERANMHSGTCRVCDALEQMPENVRETVLGYLRSRTIGRDKLVAILRANGYDVGRRSYERHQEEGHSS